MRFLTIAIPTVLTLAAHCSAWARAGNGVWVANNKVYAIGSWFVHEACTKRNTQEYWKSGPCSFWLDGNGNIHNGQCYLADARYVHCSQPGKREAVPLAELEIEDK